MLKFLGRLAAAALLVVAVPLAAMAAEVQDFRFSSGPSRIRFVVDADGKILLSMRTAKLNTRK